LGEVGWENIDSFEKVEVKAQILPVELDPVCDTLGVLSPRGLEQ
jgi:hypothetical protein